MAEKRFGILKKGGEQTLIESKIHSIAETLQVEIDNGAQRLGLIAESRDGKPNITILSVREHAGAASQVRGQWIPSGPSREVIIWGTKVIRIRPHEFDASQGNIDIQRMRPLINWGIDPFSFEMAQKATWFWEKPPVS